MKNGRVIAARLLSVGVIAAAGACGRSENVGWTDRDQPGGGAAVRETQASAAGERAAPETVVGGSDTLGIEQAEYQRLARDLEPLRTRALAEPDIQALSEEVEAALDEELAKSSDFFRKLIERKHLIEARFREAQARGETLSSGEQDTLSFHYYNIYRELAPYRDRLFQRPEYAQRLREFQAALFEKMRDLEPSRVTEIVRMEELGLQLFEELEAMTAAPQEARRD